MSALEGLSKVLESAGTPASHRLVRSVPADKILAMEREAVQTKHPPLHSLTQYWRLDVRERSREELARLLELLSALPEVDSAWEEPLSTLPVVTAGDDPCNAQQDYQDAAPDGIDARWMWTQPNGEGAGIGVVDVEGGWRVTHEDLAGKAPTLINGVQWAAWEDHGTAVPGEMLAIDNTAGVVECAPAITSIRMSSIYDAGGVQHETDALTAAVAAMVVGEILLIELQTAFLPVETLDDRLDVIRLATARGIIVVEAAGNGNSDLDAWATGGVVQKLNRGSAGFVDSGTIMVGAAESALPHDRWWASNFGSRIDCFAYGENVVTTGTAQGGGVAGAIGVMPGLNAIVPTLGLLSDVYVRDAAGDTRAVPWGGSISTSPDVIVRPSHVADPQLTYGEGSGTENSEGPVRMRCGPLDHGGRTRSAALGYKLDLAPFPGWKDLPTW